MSPTEGHLSAADVELLRGTHGLDEASLPGEDPLGRMRRHAQECRSCQTLLRAHEEVDETLKRFRVRDDARRYATCPDEWHWRSLAAGIVPDSEGELLYEHSARCDGCATLLRSAVEDLSLDPMEEELQFVAGLTSASPVWQRALAERLGALAETETSKRTGNWRRPSFLAASAAALAAILAVVGLWSAFQRREPSLDRLLAEAYAARRTFELRISGAPHAPIREARTASESALSRPASLLRAEYLIKDRLQRDPENAALLAAKGRAELLEWSYEEAILNFQESLDVLPEQPDVLRDLATAYFQRAEAESRPTDYGQAIEYLGRALAKAPNEPVALFNRAIASERLLAYTQAISDWEAYLRVDPKGEWADEARARLDAVRRRVEQSEARGSGVSSSADVAAPLLEARLRHTVPTSEWVDSSDEVYLGEALSHWLPRMGSVAGDRPNEHRALEALARVLTQEHGDGWLNDVLSHSASPHLLEGFRLLSLAIESNAAGGFDEAARHAAEARRRFDAGGCPACRLRAMWEEAYALQRAQHGQPCLDEANAALREVPPDYTWLSTQLRLEQSVCALMVGDMDVARQAALDALRSNRQSGYATQLLRSLHFAGNAVGRDDPDRAWRYFHEGLDRHWAGAYRPSTAFLFYSEMSYTAEAAGDWHLATVLLREAVTLVAMTPNRLVEAMNRHSLGVSAQFAGDLGEARAQFSRASDIFSSLPQTDLTRSFLFSAETYRASLESQSGQAASSLARLRNLQAERPETADLSQYWIWLHYFQALGEAELQQGSAAAAAPALRAAAYISEEALGTLASDADRALWERRTGRIYRALAELELEKRGDPRRALELVEWYRAAPLREMPGESSSRIRFADLATGPPLPSFDLVEHALPELTHETILSFARLSSGVYAWEFDARGIRSIQLGADPDELDRVTRRFARLCADPSSDLDELQRVGSTLYGWLVAPFAEQLSHGRTLVIEPDEVLNGIPFQALVAPDGQYLGEHYRVVYSPGLGFWTRPASRDALRDQRALVVGTSSERRVLGRLLLPLPQVESEARFVAGAFANAVVRLGESATLADVERELPSVRVFHFAGHAIAGPARRGLLLASGPASAGPDMPDMPDMPDREAPPAILDADILSGLDLRSLDLVVLSACSTAAVQGGLEDPQGLARAFLRKGVPHVVASRWAVDSSATEELVEGFYAQLATNAAPAAALEAAADELRARPRTAHPYYWAGFSVYGRS